METNKKPSPESSESKGVKENDVTYITSNMVDNANASGDGAIKRSEEAIENKNEQDPVRSRKPY